MSTNNIVPEKQFSFMPVRSTTHQLLRLTEYITSGLEKKWLILVVFLDISRAYDLSVLNLQYMRMTFASTTNPRVRDLHIWQFIVIWKKQGLGHQVANIHQHGKDEDCNFCPRGSTAIARTQT